MRKLTLSLFIIQSALLAAALTASAQTSKTITLSDGSTIKGVVKSLNNGTYTVETENLGTVQIQDSKVASITAGTAAATPGMGNALGSAMNNPAMMGQVNMLQNSIMSDPALMQEIQSLINNPKVMQALSDQQFLDDVMSYDPERIQNNPQTQKLLEDPEVKRLMELMGQKFGAGQAP